MSDIRPIFFDLETTGIRTDKDRIVEIAAIDPYQNATFQTLVNPLVAIPSDAKDIHGISDEMVQAAPTFPVVIQEFIRFCHGNVVLIAHNGESFDIPFLAAEFSRWNLILPSEWAFIDSLKWARKYRKDLPRHSLQYLRQIFEIPENRAHRALDDVQILYKVFSLMIDDLHYDEVLAMIDGYRSLQSFQKSPSLQKQKGDASSLVDSLQSTEYSLFETRA